MHYRHPPSRILQRTHCPNMHSSADFELSGILPNLVFPTALIESRDSLPLYYGAADTCIAVAEFSQSELMEALK